MAQGELFQITAKQTYLGEQLLNVYYYRQTGVGDFPIDLYDDLANLFVTNVLGNVRAIQVGQLTYTGVEVRNLSTNLQVAEIPLALGGADSALDSELSPSYLTVGFKLIRSSLATRHGYKRFSGLADDRIAGNVYAMPAGNTATLIGAALAADLNVTGGPVFEPVIVKRPIVPPMGTQYVHSDVSSAVFVGLGTQNSRKP